MFPKIWLNLLKDGNGVLTLDEIKQMFGQVGGVADDVWKEVIKEVDDNGDGNISYVEFKDMMLKLL